MIPGLNTLSQLPAGTTARIASLSGGRSSLTRLRELGLVPGTLVTVVRRAPLGEPIEISVRGSRLAMRNHEAAHIQLQDS